MGACATTTLEVSKIVDIEKLRKLAESETSLNEAQDSKSIPRNSRQNLESKIESLIRSIENLAQKRGRITYELTHQKRSLARKREELKRVSKLRSSKTQIRLESAGEIQPKDRISEDENKRIQKLLSESARILEE